MSKPNRTTFIALVGLVDAIRKLQVEGPLKPPQHGLRLALAYLYTTCLSKNGEPFDALWLTFLGRDHQPSNFRVTWAGTQYSRICQDIGVQQDILFGDAMPRIDRTSCASALAS